MQRRFWVALTLGASSIVVALFKEPLGDFIYDIFTNLFPDGQRPAQIIATFLQSYWPWALAALGAVAVLAVYGQIRWLWRQRQSSRPSVSPAIQPTITASHGSTIVTASDNATITISSGVTLDVNRLAEQLAEPYWQQLTTFQQREQLYQDQIRALTDMITALAEQRQQPDAPPGIEAALVQLQHGETEDAERIFEAIVDREPADIQEAAAALRHLGALAFLHNTNKALHVYRRTVELDPNNAEGWNQLGLLLERVGQLDEAVAAYQRVRIIGEKTGRTALQAVASGNLGNVYETRGDLEQAEAMHRQALALNEALGHKQGMASASGNLGNVYETRGNLKQAEAMYRQALALYETLGYKRGIAHQYSNLGNVYQSRGSLEQAEVMYQKALALFQQIGATLRVEQIADVLRALR